YQRLLVHRCSAYHKLALETDPISRAISVVTTLGSRIPTRRIASLVPARLSTQSTITIVRRSITDRGQSKPYLQAGSKDPELSDVKPPEYNSSGSSDSALRDDLTINRVTRSRNIHKSDGDFAATYTEEESESFNPHGGPSASVGFTSLNPSFSSSVLQACAEPALNLHW
ncbi:uncharacterized protein EDB91DRAFT_1314585, partial [Suillus paluster]|uniref:uncharacterized protein n=1 Tax=Suillus paluster TaxID=48578 RepID=UPI001B86D948